MFVLEIDFHDGSQDVESLLVRRPKFLLGSSKEAHVGLAELESLGYELKFTRNVGRKFRCTPLSITGDSVSQSSAILESGYQDEANIELGNILVRVTALDIDLLTKEGDPPDKAGVRILRHACAFETPKFPAFMMVEPQPIILSFSPDQIITVGRSNKCALRVDSPDVSSEHARMGYESGQFWIEDLGSTNGTFVDKQQISGRQTVKPGAKITLGGQTIITGIVSEDQINQLLRLPSREERGIENVPQRNAYPALVSLSELMRPAKFVLSPGGSIVMGRDPESDVWVGAPHISRKHCQINVSKLGEITLSDLSRNGIAWEGGVVTRDQPFVVEAGHQSFDLGGGVGFAICFSPEDEEIYRSNRGAFLVTKRDERKRDAGTRVDIAKLMEESPELPNASISNTRPEPINSAGKGIQGFLQRFAALTLRERLIVLGTLIGFFVIIIVILNLVFYGFS
ncbi:MAG: FHA domain-containing protein [bacterium]|nr:FHA domain-containing protein [bacterium]